MTLSLSWNTRDDLHLHVTTPSGEEIYYDHRSPDVAVGLTLAPFENLHTCHNPGPRVMKAPMAELNKTRIGLNR